MIDKTVPGFWAQTNATAFKDRQCSSCKTTIRAGDRYLRGTGPFPTKKCCICAERDQRAKTP